MKKLFSIMAKLETHYHYQLYFQKGYQHTGGKLLNHNTKHRKDNQLQSLELACRIPIREYKQDLKESEGNMFNPIFKDNVQAQKHPGRYVIQEPELPNHRKPKCVKLNRMAIKIPTIVVTIMMK